MTMEQLLLNGLNSFTASPLFPSSTPSEPRWNESCSFIHSLPSVEEKCAFVVNGTACSYDGIFYPYTALTYCQLGYLQPLAMFALICILFMLFVTIGSVADDFLCPSLLTVSKTFRLPDHIAGVTFLALGNGAPDIFSSISGISQAKPHLVFSALYGAGIFTTTVVTGTVLFSGDFAVMKRPLVRDLTFYIGAAVLVWAFILNGTLQLAHSLSLVGYYIVYIIVLVVSRFIYMRYQTSPADDEEDEDGEGEEGDKREGEVERPKVDVESADARSIKSNGRHHLDISTIMLDPPSRKHSTTSKASATGSTTSQRKRTYGYEDGIVLTRFFRSGSLRSSRRRTLSNLRHHHHAHHHFENTLAHITKVYEADRRMSKAVIEDVRYKEAIERENVLAAAAATGSSKKKPAGYHNEITFTNNFAKPKYLSQLSTASIWSAASWEAALSESRDFIIHICPIDLLEWSEYRWYRRALEIVKALPYFLMTVCIPVVDIESTNENWCRLLTCLNVFCAPQVVILLYGFSSMRLNGVFPLWSLMLLVSAVLAMVIFFTSQKGKPPVYHRLFGFIGFIMSVLFINIIAQEVIEVLTTFGVILNLSESILGLTILAWGNSLGDLIANNSLARHGYPGIAISACFGGPMLNLLMGVGLPYTILFVGQDTDKLLIDYTKMTTLLFATITASLVTTLVFFTVKRFKSSKIHGAILIAIYIVYISMAVVIEFVLH